MTSRIYYQEADRRRYLEQLRISLGVRNVPDPRVHEILAEVEDHLLASGDDPNDELGQPWQLADQLLEARPVTKPPRDPLGVAALAATAFVGPILLIHGIMALAAEDPATLHVGDVTAAALGLAAVCAWLPLAGAYFDGRRRAWLLVAAMSLSLFAVVGLRALWEGPVLYQGSGWLPVAAGSTLMAALTGLINRKVQRKTAVPDHPGSHRNAPPPPREAAAPASGTFRRILETPVMNDVSPGVSTVLVSLLIGAAATGGWLLATHGPGLSPVVTLIAGLGLGLLIGDGLGARRVRRNHGLPPPATSRLNNSNTSPNARPTIR